MIGATLARYFARRFAATMLAAFLIVFALIYTVDLVELLRRGADSPAVHGSALAWLAFLRTPLVAEETLPFAALFGAMAVFLNLSRRMELVAARAAGISVWQFVAPGIAVALAIGVIATAAYSPLSATMKRRADVLEAELLGNGAQSLRTAVWLRQRSVDGQAIIHAAARGEAPGDLAMVEVFEFNPLGEFIDRIDAASARLEPGRWVLNDVKIAAPGSETTSAETFLLATSLTETEVAQALAPADTVPFWSLPEAAELAEGAGIDASEYRLRFQELLARPALLAAMVLLAACFSLRFFRMGGVGIMVSGGVAAGFVLYVLTRLASEFGGVGLIDARTAGWAPAIVACLVGVTALLHLEDG